MLLMSLYKLVIRLFLFCAVYGFTEESYYANEGSDVDLTTRTIKGSPTESRSILFRVSVIDDSSTGKIVINHYNNFFTYM